MGGWELLLELIAALGGAFLLGTIFERLRIGAVIGYIVAGIILGPSALGIVHSLETVKGLAELGIALMLFTTGLEFSPTRLKKLGTGVLFAGLAQIVLCIIAFAALTLALGYDMKAATAVGAVVSVSSTALVLRIMRERGDLDAHYGKIAVGILILQDVALVPLVLLVTLLGKGSQISWTMESIMPAVGAFLAVAVLFIVLGSRFVPRALRSKAMATNRELPILLAVVSCTGAAWLAHSIGWSPTLGAFLAGVLLAETSFEEQIRADMAPLKALFGTLFFTSVGMLANVRWVAANGGAVLLAVLVIMALKFVVVFAAVRMFKRVTLASTGAALVLAHVGELGFILIQIAQTGGVLKEAQAQLLTSAAIVTMILSPALIAHAQPVARALTARLVPKEKLDDEELASRRAAFKRHFVIVGFGTAGKTAAAQLGQAQYTVVGVDIDPKFARQAEEHGVFPVVGDATHHDILDELHLDNASALIVALPDSQTAALVIAQARRISPDLVIVARSRYHPYEDVLIEAGATRVVSEERLLGRQLSSEAVFIALGRDMDVETA